MRVIGKTQWEMDTDELSETSGDLGAMRVRALAVGAHSVGALAIGAVAAGALALGVVAIGRLVIGRVKIKRLEIDKLVVGRLRVTDSVDLPDFAPKRGGSKKKRAREKRANAPTYAAEPATLL